MAANQKFLVYGGDYMIFINPSGSTNLQPCAFSTTAKLTVTLSTRDVSSKDSGDWNEYLGSKFDWDLTSDNLMNLSGVTGTTLSTKEVFQYFIAKQPVYIAFASKTGTSPSWTVSGSALKFTGQALITSMDMNAADKANGTYTIAMKGNGVLSIAQ